MTLIAYVEAQGWPKDRIYSHLHRHGICADTCTQLEDVNSLDHARCIEHLRALNVFHLAKITNPKPQTS